MPALTDVKVSKDLADIEREGVVYYRIADGEDPQTGDLFYVKESDVNYVLTNETYAVRVNDFGVPCLIDEQNDEITCERTGRSGNYFRKSSVIRVPSAPIAPQAIHDQLSELRRQRTEIDSRIDALEAEVASQSSTIQPGEYVKITSASDAEGEYGRYVRYGPLAFMPYEVALIPSGVVIAAMSVEPATAAEVTEYLRKVAESLT